MYFYVLVCSFYESRSAYSRGVIVSKVWFFSRLALVLLSVFLNGPNVRANLANYLKVCDPARFADLGLDMNDFLYCNSSIPMPKRVKDLVDRMSLDEKVGQLGNKASGAKRIGLPPYRWWSEALHGVSDFGDGATFFDDFIPGATSFPTPIHTAASFNESLWTKIGQTVSTEARAMHNFGRAGLTFWSPNMNTVRDPRWGPALETPGEDPFVVGIYASNYVRGLQDVEEKDKPSKKFDENFRPLKVAACCKHYVAYDVDNWLGVNRVAFNARIQERDMVETFQKPFEMCIKKGGVASIMYSYNQINGIPSCADPKLLKETVRKKWNLNGYIVSDCDSIQVMVQNQKFLADAPEDAVARVLRAGLDLDCGDFYPNYTANAVLQGKVRESDIDNALANIFTVLMRLGYFDGMSEYEKLGKYDICSQEHINLAIEAAREGIVLLKNDNQALPLNQNEIKTLAVIGPHANATSAMIGNYKGIPCRYTSPLDAFKESSKEVIYEIGCDAISCQNDSLIFPAVKASEKADATVLLVGLDLSVEAEDLDRVDLLLPGNQTKLINQVASSSRGPVILVVMSAGGVDIRFAKSNPNITAIIWAGYPGEEGGHGIADVVFGKYNPGGRLPLTWYTSSYSDMLPMTSMSLRPIQSLGYPGRTYRFFNGPVVYPFGYGLSYTTFNHKITYSNKPLDVNLNKFIKCRDIKYLDGASKPSCPAVLVDDLDELDGDFTCNFDVEVKNTGKIDGSEVVMVYWYPPKGIVDAPIKQLIAFKKVFVSAKQSTKVNFQLNALQDLGLVDYKAYTLLAAGTHRIVLGDDVASFPLNIKINKY